MNYKNNIVQEDLKDLIENIKSFDIYKNKNILITGANGMLATYFIYLLMYLNDKKNMNIKIFALSRNREEMEKRFVKDNEREDLNLIVQDVCNKINIKENIDYIIHLASSANPSTIISNPIDIIKSNIYGTFNVLDLAKEKNAEVIFSSTREIYGKMPENVEFIKESDMGSLNCFDGRACYPESKRMAETILVNYYIQYGVKFKNLRIAHTFGPGIKIEKDGRIMSDFIYDVVNKKDIVLKSDGSAKRAFCYITDAISAIVIIMEKGKECEAYNISNETEEITIKNLAELLAKKYNTNVKYEIEENKGAYTNFKRVGLDNSKLEQLGWKPEVSLMDGIDRTIKSFIE